MIVPGSIARLQTSLPAVEFVRCGEVEIAWLRAGASLEDQVIDAGLAQEERAHAATLKSAARREEYRRARLMVRRLHGYATYLAPEASGMPTWPDGLVGSITHKSGAVGVAIANASEYAAIGIDAEDVARVRGDLESRILTPSEGALLDALVASRPEPRAYWLAVAFSFKEALFKSHFPLGRTMFWFHDAAIEELDPVTGCIAARVLVPTSPRTPAGHRTEGAFAVQPSDGLTMVICTAWVPERPGS